MGPPNDSSADANDNRQDSLRRYYEAMVAARHRVVMPLVIFTLIFFFVEQILTNFTPVLDGELFFGMTWAYI